MNYIATIALLLISTHAMALRNGAYFKAEQFPEVVGSFQVASNSCTSTKIAPKTYITAAHCIKALNLEARFEQKINFKVSTKTEYSNIEKIYFHPTVDLSSFSDGKHPSLKPGMVLGHLFGNKIVDVAIYKIKEELPQIQSMSLYFGKLTKDKIISLVAYGDTGNGYALYPRWGLQKIKKISGDFIKVKHSKQYPAEIMPGDSGSPLVVTESDQHFLAGIAAWKKPGIFGGAGYFINPENFVDWAQQVIDTQIEPNLSY